MLQINTIKENPEFVIERLSVKNFKGEEIIHQILEYDRKRRDAQKNLEEVNAKSKQRAREIGNLFMSGKIQEANELKAKDSELKNLMNSYNSAMEQAITEMENLLVQIPNLPHSSVPRGKSAEDNDILCNEGTIPDLDPKVPHWDLATKYQIIDFELGNKVTGAGFPFYRGKGARLQRALINFFLDEAIKAGYLEYQPPYLINEASGFGTGQLPDKEGQMYFAGMDKLYLIPTAEVPITNIYRDVILKSQEMPIKNVAYSACFRREAGSYGKDVRGLNRLHQFDKVEIVQVAHPEKSYEILEEMRAHVAGLLHKLELPFRIVRLCGGDMSFASALTYDFEVFAAGQEKWLEVSSVSNFEAFQSNRMKLRFKNENGKMELAHTLNGSALALPRILAALLENNNTEDGIKIPSVLQPYTGFDIIN